MLNIGWMEVLLLGYLVATVVILWALLVNLRTGTSAKAWAAVNGVALTPATEPIVANYLRNSRDLRTVTAIGALFIAPAITAGTGIDLGVTGWVWLFSGYIVGCIWAEISFARIPATAGRAASLVTRRVADYLPPTMLITEAALPLVAVLLAVGVGVLDVPAELGFNVASSSTPEAQRAAVVSGGIAAVMMIAVAITQRALARRPQPLTALDAVAIDDAMRSSALHLVGASGLVAVALVISSQLAYLANALTPSNASGWLGILSVAGIALAYGMWMTWAKRGWSARRRAAVIEATVPVAAQPVDHAGSRP